MTWYQIARAIALHEGWKTSVFFQGGESRVEFKKYYGSYMGITVDRQLTDTFEYEDAWKLLCELYFKVRKNGISLEQAQLEVIAKGIKDHDEHYYEC